jgi:hypothetical protein
MAGSRPDGFLLLVTAEQCKVLRRALRSRWMRLRSLLNEQADRDRDRPLPNLTKSAPGRGVGAGLKEQQFGRFGRQQST